MPIVERSRRNWINGTIANANVNNTSNYLYKSKQEIILIGP